MLNKLTDIVMHPVSQVALMLGAVVLIGVLLATAPPRPRPIVAVPQGGGMIVPIPTPVQRLAPSPTPWPTPTPTSTPTLLVLTETPTTSPTSTPTLLILTETPTASATPWPSDTPWPTVEEIDPQPMWPTVPAQTEPPNALPIAPGDAACSCATDSLNCGNFRTHDEAQACFDYCWDQGAGDIHGLDGNDNDGQACENLP
jgi:hypothetical protein